MPGWVREGPFPLVFAFLLVVVFCRAQGTYWLGRAVAAGTLRTRWARLFEGPRVAAGAAAIQRWGWPAIPLSFLMVGVQSAVNGAAGVLRMSWPRYTLAMLPGCFAWALVYALGGLAAFSAAAGLAVRSPLALAAVVVALAGLAVGVRALVRRRRALTSVNDAARRRTGSLLGPPGRPS